MTGSIASESLCQLLRMAARPCLYAIEREFAKDFGPTVAENFRTAFLLKVGMDDPGVTRKVY